MKKSQALIFSLTSLCIGLAPMVASGCKTTVAVAEKTTEKGCGCAGHDKNSSEGCSCKGDTCGCSAGSCSHH